MMVSLEHVSDGWLYTFGNSVAAELHSILVRHDGSLVLSYLDGRVIRKYDCQGLPE